MTENEQIEEMAKIISQNRGCIGVDCNECEFRTVDDDVCQACYPAKELYAKGYRKVKPGEWRLIGNANGGFCGGVLYYRCTCCGYEITQARIGEANFCEWCGADMRGEEG